LHLAANVREKERAIVVPSCVLKEFVVLMNTVFVTTLMIKDAVLVIAVNKY